MINARITRSGPWPNLLPTGGKSMKPKHLANGFAIAAALAIASPGWAQGTPPAAGAGMQGANPMTIPAPAAPAAPANPNLPAAGARMQVANPMTIPPPAAPAAPANPNLPAAGAGMQGANPMTIP